MIRVALAYAAFFAVSLVSCSAIYGQSLDFKVDGPTTIAEGEYVELTVLFPEGENVKANVDFSPLEETNFGVHPVGKERIENGKLVVDVVGRKCTFSARCQGAREIVVSASVFALVDGFPIPKTIHHKIRVTAKQGPQPPPPKDDPPSDPPTTPTDPGDDLGPWVPIPGAAVVPPPKPSDDIEKITKILGNMMDRIEALEKRSTAVTVAAPAAVSGTAKPAAVPAPVPVVVKPAPAIVDVKPGHWSVSSARNEWSPTKEETIAHLRQTHSSADLRQYEPLESLSHEALRTLHDDAHEGRVTAARTAVSSPVSVYTQPVYSQPAVMRAGGCPGGVCPTGSSSRSYGRGVFGWRR